MENKNPPKRLKKKLPKEPLSGGGEKKLKAKGECPGDRDGLSPALLPLASVLAAEGKCLAPHCCPGRLRGLQSHRPSPCNPPSAQPFLLLRSCHILVPITAHSHPLSGWSSAPLSQQKTRVTPTAKPNLPKAPRRSQCPCSR